jgi:DNA polymerase-3 subunit epsilon
MSYLVIDTETTGLFDFSKPADADGQPRMASLSLIELDDELAQLSGCQLFVQPDGWSMSEQAASVNGLTDEFLTKHGAPVANVLEAYTHLIDGGLIVMAFNAQYDLKILRGELRRADMDDRFDRTPNICVMKACTDLCRIPGKYGWKWPKLHEACQHFGIKLNDAHTAIGDALATAEIARRLKDLGRLPEPSVKYAKQQPTA